MARRGRKPLDPNDPAIGFSCRLPSKQYDALWQLAQRHRITLPELTRRTLQRLLRTADRPRGERP